MTKHIPLALQIEEWTREAVVLCGDDWTRIAAHVSARLAESSEEDKARLQAEAALTLAAAVKGHSDGSAH